MGWLVVWIKSRWFSLTKVRSGALAHVAYREGLKCELKGSSISRSVMSTVLRNDCTFVKSSLRQVISNS